MLNGVVHCPAIGHQQHVANKTRRGEIGNELLRPMAAVAIQDGHSDVAHFERCGKGKDEQLHQRRHDQRHPDPDVTPDAEHLLDDLGPELRGKDAHRSDVQALARFQGRNPEENAANGKHRREVWQKKRPDIAGKEHGLQCDDEIACGNNVGQQPDRHRH